MHYFISTREDVNTSAIELAQVRRMKIFAALHVSSKIIELEKNDFTDAVQTELGTQGRVINIFNYFQKINNDNMPDTEQKLASILTVNGLRRRGMQAFAGDKLMIDAHTYNDLLYYVDYRDQYGFTVKRQFFVHNHLNYSEYFDDSARLKMREYVNQDNFPIIREYFCESNQKTRMRTLIEFNQDGKTLRFNQIADFQAYFLDCLVKEDPNAVFYCDRCTQVLPALQKMKHLVPSYVVFHSALTLTGYLNSDIYSVYQPIKKMAQIGKIAGTISSTKQEANDVTTILDVAHSYAIPVTYVEKKAKIDFNQRVPGKIIAVARVDAVKQLSHLIRAVIDLKPRLPQLDLSIYGNNTDEKENTKLQALVKNANAQNYIHFCGFEQDLSAVYDSAQLEVLTSKNEGFAMALAEAQAHGCPVLSYDINYGPNEIVQNGRSGLLIQANDQHALKERLFELMKHPGLLYKYSQGAYLAAERFSFAKIEDNWRNFLVKENLIKASD